MRHPIQFAWAAMLAACAAFTSCDNDSDVESRMPVFGGLTLSTPTASPGDTIICKVTFSDPGSYVNGTYTAEARAERAPVITYPGTFTCGSTRQEVSFELVIPEMNENTPAVAYYTLTVKPKSISAHVGDKLYLDPAPMGTVSATFSVRK